MKRTDLMFPFKWEERQPAIFKGVLFVPAFYQLHASWTFPEWNDSQLFGNDHPVFIEYCSGNGAWLIEQALRYPEINWVGVEKKFDRVRKIWIKAARLELKNLFIVCGEALTFTRFYLRDHSIEQSYVNFPDPWPKDRHAKNRLIQKPFAQELTRIIKPGCRSIFATDDFPYAQQICQVMLEEQGWKSSFPEPYFKTEWDNYGSSYFCSLWQEKGRTIHYIQFEHVL